jgi:hypothetical protein
MITDKKEGRIPEVKNPMVKETREIGNSVKIKSELADNTAELLGKIRNDIAKEIEDEKKQSGNQSDDSLIKKAEIKLDKFDKSKKLFQQFKEERGINTVEKKVSRIQAWAGKLAKNIGRLIGDIKRKGEIRKQIKSGEINLEKVNMQIEVMDRNALIEDARTEELWKIEDNREILTNFMEKELYQEVNATHWVMLTGASLEQVHAIVQRAGHNPDAFFSDDRGENGGRIAIDNYGEDMPIDRSDPRYDEEKKFWEPLFKNKFLPKGIKEWHMSRNHAVIYCVKDVNNKDVLMMPVHIDPKNWVVSIKELFNPPKKGERSALAYHNIAEGEKRYLGTGLYELGVYQFINLLRKKQPGLFGGLEVIGNEKLDTTRTISGDDHEALVLKKVFKEKV